MGGDETLDVQSIAMLRVVVMTEAPGAKCVCVSDLFLCRDPQHNLCRVEYTLPIPVVMIGFES